MGKQEILKPDQVKHWQLLHCQICLKEAKAECDILWTVHYKNIEEKGLLTVDPSH